jgi:hypothetical protein
MADAERPQVVGIALDDAEHQPAGGRRPAAQPFPRRGRTPILPQRGHRPLLVATVGQKPVDSAGRFAGENRQQADGAGQCVSHGSELIERAAAAKNSRRCPPLKRSTAPVAITPIDPVRST